MSTPDTHFLQIHTLTSYPGTLLNRDDAGFAKRLPFGGVSRIRISSQCLKRHWRTFEGEHSIQALDAPKSLRSRYTFEVRVARPMIEAGEREDVTREVVAQVMDAVLGASSDSEELKTGQITVLGEPEVEMLSGVSRDILARLRESDPDLFEGDAREGGLDKAQKKKVGEGLKAVFDKEQKKNLKGLEMAAGLSAALFGRMVTSDLLARGDAAIHVAHAFTVHEEESESDYFSAIDDLLGELEGGDEESRGSGHINSVELTSGLYYGYVVVDVPLLVSNLTGCAREDWREADHTIAKGVIERLIHVISTVSPGAKLGSTAPYANAECVLVEAGSSQPRTLANAFMKPVRARGDQLAAAYEQLGAYWADHAQMYGATSEVRFAARGDVDALQGALGHRREPLRGVASWAAASLGGEQG